MAPLTPIELPLIIGVVVFLGGGVIAYYRSSVTIDTALVLVLFALSCSLTGVVEVSAIHADAENGLSSGRYLHQMVMGTGELGVEL